MVTTETILNILSMMVTGLVSLIVTDHYLRIFHFWNDASGVKIEAATKRCYG